MEFDPDAYISSKAEFDPDAYITKRGSGKPADVGAAAKPDESLWEKTKEFFSGSKRTTPAMERLPELHESGILSEESAGTLAKLAPALLTTTNPDEIVKIITSSVPTISVIYEKDGQGNVYPILKDEKTGALAQVNKPGFTGLDALQGLGLMAAFTPAGKAGASLGGAAKVGAVAGASGATSAAMEAGQTATGGDFDIQNVILDTVAAGAFEAVPAILKAYKAKAGRASSQATKEAVEAETTRIGQTLSPESQAVRQESAAKTLVETVEKTGKKQKAAIRDFATEVLPDEKVLTSAKALGVEGDIIPSHYSKNQTYVEIEQGLASIPGSKLSAQQKDATIKVAQKADDLITEFGGTTDKSELSEILKDQVLGSISKLDDEAEAIYKLVNDNIPATTRADTTKIKGIISGIADDLGGAGNLEPIEKRILSIVKQDGGPTYALLDKERKKIGQALRKASGPYKDSDSGTLKTLYGALTETQGAVAKTFGMDDVWKTGKSLVQQRKILEEQSINLLGKDKAGAIMPKVGLAVKKLSTGDYKAFDQIMGSIPPEHKQAVVMSALNDAFTMGSRQEKQLSAPGFADWMTGLNRNKAAKKRIYENLPDGAGKRLDDLFNVANGMRNASKEKIYTGRIVGLLDNFADVDGMVSKLYQTGRRVAVAEGATSSAGLPGAGTAGVVVDALSKKAKEPIIKAADELLSSPQFQSAARNYASSTVRSDQAIEAAKQALLKSEKAQKWVSLLPSEDKRIVLRAGVLSYLGSEE